MYDSALNKVAEAYEKMYKKLPQRRLIKVSAAIPMLMEEEKNASSDDENNKAGIIGAAKDEAGSQPAGDNGAGEAAAASSAAVMESSSTIKLYRGVDGDHIRNDGVSDERGLIWTTDDASYAKVYAVDKKNPKIIEYVVSEEELSIPDQWQLDDAFGYEVEGQNLLDGPDDETLEKLLTRGFNCISFLWEDYMVYILLNKDAVISQRVLSDDEYNSVEAAW